MNGIDNTSTAARPAIVKLVFLVLALVLVLSLGIIPAQAKATTYTESYSVEFELHQFIDCALGGVGEEVHLSGPLHILFTTTINDNGSFMSKILYQPQGISGTGLTSGDRYQAVGETQDIFIGRVGYLYTYVNNYKIVGQGPGNNFMIHENLHITVNPNGTVTAEVDNFSVACNSS